MPKRVIVELVDGKLQKKIRNVQFCPKNAPQIVGTDYCEYDCPEEYKFVKRVSKKTGEPGYCRRPRGKKVSEAKVTAYLPPSNKDDCPKDKPIFVQRKNGTTYCRARKTSKKAPKPARVIPESADDCPKDKPIFVERKDGRHYCRKAKNSMKAPKKAPKPARVIPESADDCPKDKPIFVERKDGKHYCRKAKNSMKIGVTMERIQRFVKEIFVEFPEMELRIDQVTNEKVIFINRKSMKTGRQLKEIVIQPIHSKTGTVRYDAVKANSVLQKILQDAIKFRHE